MSKTADSAIRKGNTLLINGALLTVTDTLRPAHTGFISWRATGETIWRVTHAMDKVNIVR